MKYLQIFEKKVIYRSQGIPYLRRWNLLGIGKDSSIFSIKIHNILVSDDACMHDHPWGFLSIILKGGYKETHGIKELPKGVQIADAELMCWKFDHKSFMWSITKSFKAGNILYRPPNWIHKLEIDKPAWTLVFTFRKVKKWGFFTTKGWIPFYQYSKEKDC